MIESWRDKSGIGTIDARNGLVTEFSNTDRLVDLLEKIVLVSYPVFTPMVEGLVALIKDKQNLQEEFKRIILRTSPGGLWTALDIMYLHFQFFANRKSMTEELDRQREASRSAVSSNLKRGREHDEEMEINSRDGSLHDQSLPTSVVDNVSEVHETTPINVESLADGESVGHEIGIEFGIPHELTEHHESFPESTV